MPNLIDLTGFENDKIKVWGLSTDRIIWPSGAIRAAWIVQCKNCNNMYILCGKTIRDGGRGCKCLGKRYLHTLHPLNNIWRGMIDRCENPKNHAWNSYGGRGIKICCGLKDILYFAKILGNRPNKGYSLDRINNDLGYFCGSCNYCLDRNLSLNVKWSTDFEQSCNRRSNKLVDCEGETIPMKVACKKLNIPYKLLWKRMKKFNQSFEEARDIYLERIKNGQTYSKKL